MNFLTQTFKYNIKRLKHKKRNPNHHFKTGDRVEFISLANARKNGYKVYIVEELRKIIGDKILTVENIRYIENEEETGGYFQKLIFKEELSEIGIDILIDSGFLCSNFFQLSRKQRIGELLKEI